MNIRNFLIILIAAVFFIELFSSFHQELFNEKSNTPKERNQAEKNLTALNKMPETHVELHDRQYNLLETHVELPDRQYKVPTQKERPKRVLPASYETPVYSYQGFWFSAYDVLIDEDQIKNIDANGRRGKTTIFPQYWPGSIPYLIDSSLADIEPKIEAAIAEINSLTNARFVPYGGESDYVRIDSAPPELKHCYSNLGYLAKGEQHVLLNKNCLKGSIQHELMHTLGLVHEQSRSDREQYIQVHWDNIDPLYHAQFQIYPESVSNPGKQPFDFKSILLYGSNYFAEEGTAAMTKQSDGTTFEANKNLSVLDIKRIDSVVRAPIKVN